MHARFFDNFINLIQQTGVIPMYLRTAFLRFLGCKIGSSSRIASDVFIGSYRNLVIDENVFINIKCFLDGVDKIKIGYSVKIGPYVKILTGSHTVNPGVLRRCGNSKNISKAVEINRGVWIGMGSIIMPGVIIAEGCVIAAGTVLTKSTEPNGLYAGNPAIRIKDLPVDD